jgi:putative serine protease PepD
MIDSPANEAGLRQGDLVTAVGDQAIATSSDLLRSIQTRRPGDRISLGISRGTETVRLEITLGERPF